MIRKARRKNLYKEISNQILSMIQEGSWKPGQKIPGEIELAERFEVSRNSVRESIKALELVGILASRSGKGTFVAENALNQLSVLQDEGDIDSEAALVELMEVREALEPGIVALAILKASDEDIALIDETFRTCVKATENRAYDFSIGFEFHRAIFRVADNRTLNSILESVGTKLIAVRKAVFFKHNNTRIFHEELVEHEQILKLIKKRDADGAMLLMRRHIKHSLDRVLPYLKSGDQTPASPG